MKTLLAIALLLAPFAGFAQESSCQIDAGAADINFEPMTPGSTQRIDYGLVSINCASGLAYQLEVSNAEAGGVIPLLGKGTGKVIPAILVDMAGNRTLGQAANGEGLPGEGVGAPQTLSIKSTVSTSLLPVADVYQGNAQLILLF